MPQLQGFPLPCHLLHCTMKDATQFDQQSMHAAVLPASDIKSRRGLPSSSNLVLPHRNECDVLVDMRGTTHMPIARPVYIEREKGESSNLGWWGIEVFFFLGWLGLVLFNELKLDSQKACIHGRIQLIISKNLPCTVKTWAGSVRRAWNNMLMRKFESVCTYKSTNPIQHRFLHSRLSQISPSYVAQQTKKIKRGEKEAQNIL